MNADYELIGILITVIIQALYTAFKIGRFEEKLINMEKKQDKHNNVIERLYATENRVGIIEEQIKVENHRINDLEAICK